MGFAPGAGRVHRRDACYGRRNLGEEGGDDGNRLSGAPEVFARKASGLVREMSPWSAFVYNVLTMGLIFPWTYLWGPFAAPGANIALGIVIAIAAQILDGGET